MHTTKTHLRGLAPMFLLLLLTACASKPIIKTHDVPVAAPVFVAIDAELTAPVAEPVLPPAPTNADIAEWADALKTALRTANAKLGKILGLQPTPPAK